MIFFNQSPCKRVVPGAHFLSDRTEAIFPGKLGVRSDDRVTGQSSSIFCDIQRLPISRCRHPLHSITV